VSVVDVVPMGEQALLVRCSDLNTVHRLHAALREIAPAAVAEVVPGWDSLLLVGRPGAEASLDSLGRQLPDVRLPARTAVDRRVVEIPVTYDGPDLADVAKLTGLTRAEVVARHSAPKYVVAFLGFAPGFPYLVGLDPALRVPRLPTPRTSVPAGSVGIAGDQTGVYPRPTPGGWRIVGHTDVPLFDPAASPPTLLAPGDLLRFVPA
jgi:KipI family sensor histidine kinase inhibitor